MSGTYPSKIGWGLSFVKNIKIYLDELWARTIGTADLDNGAVTAAKLADANVTPAKLSGGFFKQTIIDGGAAGDHAVEGISESDELVAVIRLTSDPTHEDMLTDLTDEFEITHEDNINNLHGTATTGDRLWVWYLVLS